MFEHRVSPAAKHGVKVHELTSCQLSGSGVSVDTDVQKQSMQRGGFDQVPSLPESKATQFMPWTTATRQVSFFETLEEPTPYADSVFAEVCKIAGVDAEGIVFRRSEYCPNAMALAPLGIVRGERQPIAIPMIVYGPDFMRQVELASDNDKVGKLILAHELGHLVKGHVLPDSPYGGKRHAHEKELEADFFAGEIAGKLGANLKDLEQMIRQIFTLDESASHPDSLQRIESLVNGWRQGGGRGSDDVEQIKQQLAAAVKDMVSDYRKW